LLNDALGDDLAGAANSSVVRHEALLVRMLYTADVVAARIAAPVAAGIRLRRGRPPTCAAAARWGTVLSSVWWTWASSS